MNNDNRNIVYTAKDIEEYLSGALPPDQMHAMEKAALDDPFLAEAMEGFEQMRGREWSKQLAILNQYFKEKKAGAKMALMPRTMGNRWKAAAAILVIGLGTVLTYILTNEKAGQPGNKEIAQTITAGHDSSPVKTTPVPADNEKQLANPTGKTERPLTLSDAEKKAGKKELSTENLQAFKADSNFIYKPANKTQPDLVKTAREVSAEETFKSKNNVASTNPMPPPQQHNPSISNEVSTVYNNGAEQPKRNNVNTDEDKKKLIPGAVQDIKTEQLYRHFIAQVLAPDNTPLPFANISIKRENFGTYADVKGNFRLVSPDTLLKVEIRSVGYQPQVFTLHSNWALNKITLKEENVTMLEKTILKDRSVANIRISGRTSLMKDSVLNLEPADGWDNYGTYIANNIDIPDDIIKNDKHGELEISFEVKANGNISNVRIGESDCDHCAKSAKRLIEQGPQWKVTRGRKAAARIRVQF